MRSEFRRISATVLGASRADQTDVEIFANDSALTRFANNYIHQNVEQSDVDVRVRAVIGQKIGVASTNEISDEALQRVAQRAYELAEHQRENEDFRSLPRPQPVRRALLPSSSAPRAAGRRSAPAVVQQICDASSRAALTAAGAYHTTRARVRGRELTRRLGVSPPDAGRHQYRDHVRDLERIRRAREQGRR